MKKDIDIEDLLKRYRNDPSQRVRRAVMSRFRETYGRGEEVGRLTMFWRRAVPINLAAVILIIVSGLSFLVGLSIPREKKAGGEPQVPLQQTEITDVQELKWEVAENDIL